MLVSQKLAIAAHLHVMLRRKTGRVTDTEWMAQNVDYAMEIVRFARTKAAEDNHPDLLEWADKLEKAVMEPEYYGYLIKLKVCVNHLPPGSTGGKTRISWDPWTISTNHGTRHPSVQEDPPVPTFPLDYQSEGQFAVGECAAGWLPFWDLKLNDKITTINYKNTLGDKAKWTPSKTLLTLGQTKTFKYFTVRVTHVQAEEFWFGVKAKVCVRKLPPGSPGHKTRVSWDPWSLSTDHGTIPMAIAQEGTSPWSDVFAESIRLRRGECTSGWLPFAAHDDVAVAKVKYRNSLGNTIAWVI